jgi:glutathione synthase/RimK-type ligase-like ATP-grasp enzyme
MINELIRIAKELGVEATRQMITHDDVSSGQIAEKLGDCVWWRNSELTAPELLTGLGYMRDKLVINTVNYSRPSTSSKFFQQKLLLNSVLSDYALPAYMVQNYAKFRQAVEEFGLKYPLVLKPPMGTTGRGISLVRDENDARRADGFYRGGLMLSPYIENDGDYRVFVIGGVAYGAMKRIGNDDPADFVAKSAGVKRLRAESAEIEEDLRRIAAEVASLLHLEYAGIDIVREAGTGRYYVLDVNVSGGWQNGYRAVTGDDVPRETLQWFIDMYETREAETPQRCERYLRNRMKRLQPETRERVEAILAGDDAARDIDTSEAVWSWSGNYMVVEHDLTTTGLSTAHTLENGALVTAKWLAGHR